MSRYFWATCFQVPLMPFIVTAVLVSQLLGFGLAEIWASASAFSGAFYWGSNLLVYVTTRWYHRPKKQSDSLCAGGIDRFYCIYWLCVPVFPLARAGGDTWWYMVIRVPYRKLVVRIVKGCSPYDPLVIKLSFCRFFGAYGSCTNLCDASLGLRLWHDGRHDGRVYWSWKAPRSSLPLRSSWVASNRQGSRCLWSVISKQL